ncbi:hypothetical protein GINT2_000580 [Glugoides intestinalis]
MTATKKPFDNISGELTLKEVLSMNIFGSLFNTAMFIVASIFIFLAIIWLYYRNYYFKALGIMKTMGLLVSSGILFGVTFKVLLTTIRVLAGSYGCVNCSNVKLTLVVTVSIMFLSLSLLFRKESHKNIGLLPKQATALNAKAQEQADLAAKAALAKAQAQDALAQAKAAQAVFDEKATQAAQAAQATQAAQAALAKAQAQDALAAQAALAQAEAAQAVFDEKVAQAKAAQAVFDEKVAQAKAAQAAFEQALRDAQKTPQGQTVVSASLPKAANN